jgi:2-dehydro-3-deoxyphosphooctonate aldolase (KDO 8-P synthase)
MQQFGVPVILDVTHALQQPNQVSGVTGGAPGMIEYMARAGIAVGVDGIFLETHPRPDEAKSDGLNMLPLHRLDALLEILVRLQEVVREL